MLKPILIGIVVALTVIIGGIFATGNGQLITLGWVFMFGGPRLPFNPDEAVTPPDYTDERFWAALPSRTGVEDYVPTGVSQPGEGNTPVQGEAPVDVFFHTSNRVFKRRHL